jgi:hypothetical protein
VRVATPTTSVRSYTDTGPNNGVQYFFWIKARQSTDNVWVNSNAASVIPMAGSGGNTLHWPLTGNPGTHDPTRSTKTMRGGSSRSARASSARCRATAGGQDIAGTSVIVRDAYDAQDNGNAKLLISNLNWDADGWPRY